jgi:hypothetical protein
VGLASSAVGFSGQWFSIPGKIENLREISADRLSGDQLDLVSGGIGNVIASS